MPNPPIGRRLRFFVTAAASLLVTVYALPSAMATPPLKMPYPCGETYRITQGHNTGSHTGKGAWAWDIGIGVGGEVAAPADGTIRMVRMDSTTGGCDSAYANDANYVIVDFGDGTEALFLHLQANSTSLQPGDTVRQGDVVGKVGLTGWVCGAHLHFQIQNTCGSWWCQSVQSSFEKWGDPGYDTYITSENCGGPPPACEVRLTGDGTSAIVDETDSACFERVTSYWWDVAEGHNGHHYYTFTTDAPSVETWGRWHFHVDVAGDYRVEAHIPNTEASSQQAVYDIYDGNQTLRTGQINQATRKGWVDLGTYAFSQGDDRHVTLGDNTGENYNATMRKLAYDALRLTWVPPTTPMDPGMTDTGAGTDTSMPSDTMTSDTGSADTGSSGTDTFVGRDTQTGDTATGDSQTGADGSLSDGISIGGPDGQSGQDMSTSGDADDPTGALPQNASGNCACSVRSEAPRGTLPAAMGAVLLLGMVWRRRRG